MQSFILKITVFSWFFYKRAAGYLHYYHLTVGMQNSKHNRTDESPKRHVSIWDSLSIFLILICSKNLSHQLVCLYHCHLVVGIKVLSTISLGCICKFMTKAARKHQWYASTWDSSQFWQIPVFNWFFKRVAEKISATSQPVFTIVLAVGIQSFILANHSI